MKHLKIIIEREYLNKIRNKSFIIMTFVSPLIVVAFALIIGFLTDVNSKSNAKDILILDESGLFGTTFTDTETIHYEYLKEYGGYYVSDKPYIKMNLYRTKDAVWFMNKRYPIARENGDSIFSPLMKSENGRSQSVWIFVGDIPLKNN